MVKKINNLSPLVAMTYFRTEKRYYHRPWTISRLSSEWDQVEQARYHRHQKG